MDISNMNNIESRVQSYWTKRAHNFNIVRKNELNSSISERWREEIVHFLPEGKVLQILDVGTGTGYFAILLSQIGHQVTGIDLTDAMLKEARDNAALYQVHPTFQQMDAQKLAFLDQSFDVVISRNLTWTLPDPESAYREWMRVLKKGGRLLNFDANWYGYLYDDKKREAYENDRKNVEKGSLDDHYLCTDIDRMEKIALQVPLSETKRPGWDVKVLEALGAAQIQVNEDIWQQVWSEEEKLNYGSTPMFMVEAVK